MRTPADPSLDDKRAFPAWWAAADKAQEHDDFISITSRCFNELFAVQSGDTREAVVAGLEAYSNFYRNYTYGGSDLAISKRVVVKIIPHFAKRFLKNLFGRLRARTSVQYSELLRSAEALEKSGVRVDYSELKKFRKPLSNFMITERH